MDINSLRAQVDYVMDTSSLDAGTAKVKAHGDAAAVTAAKVEIFQRQTTIQEKSLTRVASKLDAYTRLLETLK